MRSLSLRALLLFYRFHWSFCVLDKELLTIFFNLNMRRVCSMCILKTLCTIKMLMEPHLPQSFFPIDQLTLIRAAIKKGRWRAARSYLTPQATNRKEGGAPAVVEALTSHLQKELENPVYAFTSWMKNHSQQHLFDNTFNKIKFYDILQRICEFLKRYFCFFYFRAFYVVLVQIFESHIRPRRMDLG